MQLMCRHSEEGEVDCLNIFDVDVKRFVPQKHEDKVPHMGWNTIGKRIANCLKGSLKKSLSILYIASMCRSVTLLLLQLTIFIRSVLHCIKITFYATQFHPEKSGKTGEKILDKLVLKTAKV